MRVELAPAKINLGLEVVRKREDGFHDLKTLMVPVAGLHDILTFKEAQHYTLSCNLDGVPCDESNLVTKAVRAFEKASNLSIQHSIHLEKNIPHGAGLAGGSSDAATALLVLNELYDTKFSKVRLAEVAASFGSDIPFFIYQKTCYCEGRGEVITPVDFSEQSFPVLLLKPAFGVSTPEAFRRWKTARKIEGISYDPLLGPYGLIQNDLEVPVFEKYPFLGLLKQWLNEQPEVSMAQMSGSGSTILAILDDLSSAEELAKKAKEKWDPHLWSWSGMS